MTFSIAIRTVDRVVDYCRSTLVRLAESGSLQHPELLGLHVSHGESLTPNGNGCRALRMAVRDEADWVVFLEDDVDTINDFVGSLDRWLDRFACEEILAYPLSCFYPAEMRTHRATGAWKYPIDRFYGSQGFAIRTADASDFAAWLVGLGKSPERDVSFDLHLAQWHVMKRPNQKELITPAPCFLDHTGEFSSLGPPGSWERVGRVTEFAGRDWSYRG